MRKYNFDEIKSYILPSFVDKVEGWVRNEIKRASTPRTKIPACPIHGKKEMKWDSTWYCGEKADDGIICGYHPDRGRRRERKSGMHKSKVPNEVKIKLFTLPMREEMLCPNLSYSTVASFLQWRKRRPDYQGEKYSIKTTPKGILVTRTK